MLEFERKRLAKDKEKRPDGTVKTEDLSSPSAASDRKRPSKWSEAVKPPPDAPLPFIPGLGLPLSSAVAIAPSAVYNPLQQAITIAARLKTLTHKPASIPPTAPAPAYVPTSAATAAAVAAAAVAARERAAKVTVSGSVAEDEINRKRQAALTLLRENTEKKRKQLAAG